MARQRVSGSGTVVGGREPVGPARRLAASAAAAAVLLYTRLHTHALATVSRRFVARSAVRRSVRVILSGSGVVYNKILIINGILFYTKFLSHYTHIHTRHVRPYTRNIHTYTFTRIYYIIRTHVRRRLRRFTRTVILL